MPETLRPIKVVLPSDGDIQRPSSTGGERKVFGEVTIESREILVNQISGVQEFFHGSFISRPRVPAVGRVLLREEALAKSHRPHHLFSSQTCPIIGAGRFGDLLISVRPDGLQRLANRIRTDDSLNAKANISTIDRIVPYTPDDVLGPDGTEALSRDVEGNRQLKLKLFRHHDSGADDRITAALHERLAELHLPPVESIYYAAGLSIYRVRIEDPAMIPPLAAFVGAQRISAFPTFSSLRPTFTPVGSALSGSFSTPNPGVDYPTVGIVDSGVDPDDPVLAPWIAGREIYVAPHLMNHNHGSFVAGLITHPRELNKGHAIFPDIAARVVDVVAIPGLGEGLKEDELLSILRESLPKYPHVHVWNLSLGGSNPCTDECFSDLAVALDALQDEFDVTFVLAAGNYETKPYRSWPPKDDLGEADRVCPPADSIRGITVGSVAHLDNDATVAKATEPSPFSRRGPGPVFVPKPELVHVGGNVDKGGGWTQTGVLSFDGHGNVAECVGTSFATPLVSGLVANVRHAIDGVSRNLLKALVIHSAVLTSSQVSAQHLRYRGFGTPTDLGRILGCDPSTVTLVFEPDLEQGLEYHKRRFPIPDCLRTDNGAVRGEFMMTLVYDPPLDGSFGAEYVRTNIDVSLGTYKLDKKGKLRHMSQVPQEPGDLSRLFEKSLVEHGFKWSPVKVYRRKIKRGVSGDEWRLLVTLNNRSGATFDIPQSMGLLVTMRDPDGKAPVYDETVRLMTSLGWAIQDLSVQERVRVSA